MIISDEILSFDGSVGDRHFLQVTLSPDSDRPSDRWLVEPGLHIEDIFARLYESSHVDFEAQYDGDIDNDKNPTDLIVGAKFTFVPRPIVLLTAAPTGDPTATFAADSFHGVVGRHDFVLTPVNDKRVPISFVTQSFTLDDQIATSVKEVIQYLLTRLRPKATVYQDGIVFETIEA